MNFNRVIAASSASRFSLHARSMASDSARHTPSSRFSVGPLLVLTALGGLHCSSSIDYSPAAAGAPAQGGAAASSGVSGSASIGGSSAAGSSAGGLFEGAATGGSAARGDAGGAGTPGTANGGAATDGGGASAGGAGGASAGVGGQAAAGAFTGGAAGQGGGPGFTLSSSKLTAGAAFPAEYTCANAMDHSPPFSWAAGPNGTLSYALVLLDTNNMFTHWVLWDIPPATTLLPESLPTTAALNAPAGAKQRAGQGMGYLGPCPNGTTHTYVFTLYALDVATLPGVTQASSTAQLRTIIEMHDLASAQLSGTSNAKPP